MRSWLRAPMFWILAAAAVMRLAGLLWGLPASDGWDDDGFAPRNFLTALALTWAPGSFFTYPPLHALLLSIPSLPVAAIALAHAPSLHQPDVIGEITKPAYMTYFAVVARLVSLAMSLGVIWCVGEMARLLAGARAAQFAAGACALGVTLTYYGQVSNLDVPYLFWSMLSLLALMRAIVRHEPRRFWHAALLAAAAVATKDQAYALFLLSLPAILLLWFVVDPWPRRNAHDVIVTLLLAGAGAILALLLVDGAITNPGGFVRRLAFLTGPASSDYAAYVRGDLWPLLADITDWFGHGYVAIAGLLTVLGLGICIGKRDERPVWVAGFLPVLAIVSFTLCFNLAALRTDARFLLPQAVLASIYIGIAAERLAFMQRFWIAATGRAVLVVTALFALHTCIAVNAAMLLDPRYDAERWMAAHVEHGDSIETYGQNAYLPRFPKAVAVDRVGQGALKARNPLPGVTELRQPFDSVAARNPRFILVNDWWLRHYTSPESELGGHRIASKAQQALFNDFAARRYFTALRAGRLNYRLAHASTPATGFWPQVHIHESLNETILIFERVS
jgi:4-amino-4-deoxy-L-arabinose transferase-like glycosyltransferase